MKRGGKEGGLFVFSLDFLTVFHCWEKGYVMCYVTAFLLHDSICFSPGWVQLQNAMQALKQVVEKRPKASVFLLNCLVISIAIM